MIGEKVLLSYLRTAQGAPASLPPPPQITVILELAMDESRFIKLNLRIADINSFIEFSNNSL